MELLGWCDTGKHRCKRLYDRFLLCPHLTDIRWVPWFISQFVRNLETLWRTYVQIIISLIRSAQRKCYHCAGSIRKRGWPLRTLNPVVKFIRSEHWCQPPPTPTPTQNITLLQPKHVIKRYIQYSSVIRSSVTKHKSAISLSVSNQGPAGIFCKMKQDTDWPFLGFVNTVKKWGNNPASVDFIFLFRGVFSLPSTFVKGFH